MRVMVIVKANKDSEAGIMPSQEILAAMGKYNEELVKAGVMLAGEGLHPRSKGKRVKFSGGKHTVTDGPFTETKELIAGFWLWQVQVDGRGGGVAQAQSLRRRHRDRNSPGVRERRTSARNSLPNSGSRRNACASRSPPESNGCPTLVVPFFGTTGWGFGISLLEFRSPRSTEMHPPCLSKKRSDEDGASVLLRRRSGILRGKLREG